MLISRFVERQALAVAALVLLIGSRQTDGYHDLASRKFFLGQKPARHDSAEI